MENVLVPDNRSDRRSRKRKHIIDWINAELTRLTLEKKQQQLHCDGEIGNDESEDDTDVDVENMERSKIPKLSHLTLQETNRMKRNRMISLARRKLRSKKETRKNSLFCIIECCILYRADTIANLYIEETLSATPDSVFVHFE